jgi:hypothetical protein
MLAAEQVSSSESEYLGMDIFKSYSSPSYVKARQLEADRNSRIACLWERYRWCSSSAWYPKIIATDSNSYIVYMANVDLFRSGSRTGL